MKKCTAPFLAVAMMLIGIAPASADEQTRFIRFLHGNDSSSGALQIAAARYRSEKTGVEVVLYGVVHIADRGYYRQVQRDLDSHDVVCYELVKPGKGERVPQEEGIGIGALQKGLCEILGLSFQKDGINYKSKNFVHADMTFGQLRKASGGNLQQALPLGNLFNPRTMKMIAPFLKMGLQFVKGLFSMNPALRESLKLRLAQQLTNASAMIPEGMKRILIVERNKVAMKVLENEIAKRNRGTISLFYGAAHMEDFHHRLVRLGYRQVGKQWVTAWTIGSGPVVRREVPRRAAPPAARTRRKKLVYY